MKAPPLVQSLGSLLDDSQPAIIKRKANGLPHIVPMSHFSRLWHWNDSHFHTQRLSDLAALMARILQAQKRMPIVEAEEDRTINIGRALSKNIAAQGICSPENDYLAKQVTAAKLGSMLLYSIVIPVCSNLPRNITWDAIFCTIMTACT